MDHRTLDFYEQRGREWADVLPSTWSLELDPFLDLLSPGARFSSSAAATDATPSA
jgi:hypothetical protein